MDIHTASGELSRNVQSGLRGTCVIEAGPYTQTQIHTYTHAHTHTHTYTYTHTTCIP
jgi:hypothetical protein